MEIYVIDHKTKKGKTVIVLEKAEGQELVKAMGFAASNNKRKKTWVAMAKELSTRLCCF